MRALIASASLHKAIAAVAIAFAVSSCGDDDAPTPPGPPRSVTVDVSGDPVRVTTAVARAEIERSVLRLSVYPRSGAARLARQSGGLFYERDGRRVDIGRVSAARTLDNGVALTAETSEGLPVEVTVRFASNRTLEVTLQPANPESLTAVGDRWESPSDEVIYGLTERLRDSPPLAPGVIDIPQEDIAPLEVGSLDRRGERVEMYVRPTFALYAPFYHSSYGYGLAVDGSMIGEFDVASSDPQTLSFRFETGTRPENRRLLYRIFVGPDHAAILDEYTARIGRPFVPPDWAFLNWRWRDELDIGTPAELDGALVNAEVAEDVHMFETLDIPAGVYLFDRPVFPGNFGFARFDWDETRLPNPRPMLAALERRGYRLAVWSAAWACGSNPGENGIEAQQLGFIAPGPVGPPNCADAGGTSFIFDVTQPEARTWFKDRLTAFLSEYHIDAIKLDRGEEHIPSAAGDIWGDGRNGREVRNDYVALQAAMHREALAAARSADDTLVISRSGYTGTARQAIVWGGDIPGSEGLGRGAGTDLGLRAAIIMQQRAAFLGYPIWGSDIGGYYGFKDREVFARWIEFGAFSGIMEIGGKGSHSPWDMPTEPRFDTEMIDIYRRYTRLRVELLDYIAAAAAQAGRSGLPIVRPMVFVDRDDPALRDRWDQYMFGPDLMVAPVWHTGQRSREVYFPHGRWRSFWDETQLYEGPATALVQTPLDVIPVFVRGEAARPGS